MIAKSDTQTAGPSGHVGDDTLLTIQYLRGAAALAVTVYHSLQWADGGFEIGRAGVDVFFVISGVVMWRITAGRRVTPGSFLVRRVTRVAPLYWIITLAVCGIALPWPGFLPEVLPDAGHLALSLGFLPHFDPRGRPFPLLPPGWTLNYEAIFYLLFAAALLLPARWRAIGATVGLLAIVIAGFALSDPAYVLGANPMLLQFAAGLWLGVAMQKGALPDRAWGIAMLLLGIVAFAGLQITGFIDELWRPLLWGVPAVLVVGGALSIETNGAVAISRPLKTLGDASYALYLVHLPATALVAHTLGWSHPWLFVAVSVAASVASALACHALIEKPTIAWLRGPSLSMRSIGGM